VIEYTYHGTVPAVGVRVCIISLNDSCVARLEVFSSWWLDLHEGFIKTCCTVASAVEIWTRR
jgi:hypothetical protein